MTRRATAVGVAPALVPAAVELWQCRAGASGGVDLGDLLDRAGDEGARTLFVEGGGGLAASFLAQDLVDRLEWFRAPIVIGGDGLAAVASVDVSALGDTKRYRLAAAERIGDDGLETYVRIEEN